MEDICQICFDLPKQTVKKLKCWIARQSLAINNFIFSTLLYKSIDIEKWVHKTIIQALKINWMRNLITMHKLDVSIISFLYKELAK